MKQIAQVMWDAYSKQAGTKSFDGKPLPTWEELGSDRQQCWIAAAKATADVALRDSFAGQALQGLMTSLMASPHLYVGPEPHSWAEGFAVTAYKVADAMLVARQKQEVSDAK